MRILEKNLARQGISGGLAAVLAFVLLLAAVHSIYQGYFPLPGYRMGHDYSLGLTAELDGLIWYQRNGLQVPWFTPSFCAGLPYYADPQSGYYSLLQLMMSVSGPLMANYLTLLICFALAYWGGYVLMKQIFQTSDVAAILTAGLLMMNGFLPNRMIVGHLGFHGVVLIPWLAFFLLYPARSKLQEAILIVCAGLIVSYWVQGGMGTLMLAAALAVMVLAIMKALQGGRLTPFVYRGAAAGLLAIGISASKLVAAFAFMGNFTRDMYPLPGAQSVVDAIAMVLASMFMPSEQVFEFMNTRLANVMWTLTPHEWAYSFTWITAILLLLLLALPGRLTLPSTRKNRVLMVFLVLCLAWPVAYCTYSPGWNAVLKSLPILGTASTPTRWMIVFIPFVAVMAGIMLHRSAIRPPVKIGLTVATFAGMVAITSSEPRNYYKTQEYDIAPVVLADQMLRSGAWHPEIKEVGVTADFRYEKYEKKLYSNDTFLSGVSQIYCYNPIFGYRLEKFKADDLRPGSVFNANAGYLNLKNPACYVYPKENNCKPGDRFRADQIDEARRFVAYQSFQFSVPAKQIWANYLSILSLAFSVSIICAYFIQAGWRRYGHVGNRR